MNTGYELYLDLMMRCLTDWIYDGANERVRVDGRDWPARAHTMIGLKPSPTCGSAWKAYSMTGFRAT